MKRRPRRKLHLQIETLHRLAWAVGGVTDGACNLGDTVYDTCTAPPPVPSVDGCGSNLYQCASASPPGCNSGTFATCLC